MDNKSFDGSLWRGVLMARLENRNLPLEIRKAAFRELVGTRGPFMGVSNDKLEGVFVEAPNG